MQPGVTRRELSGGGRRVTVTSGVNFTRTGRVSRANTASWSSGERGS